MYTDVNNKGIGMAGKKNKEPAKMGAPLTYSLERRREIIQDVIDWMGGGGTVQAFLYDRYGGKEDEITFLTSEGISKTYKRKDLPVRPSFYKWLKLEENNDLMHKYNEAFEDRSECYYDKLQQIAEEGIDGSLMNAKSNIYKKLAAWSKPKKYGEKQTLDINQSPHEVWVKDLVDEVSDE